MTAHTTDPTEMELRVARALHNYEWTGQPNPEDFAVCRSYWVRMARAAIQAMREPTEKMYDAGMAEIDHIDGHLGVAFTAMIDAASPPAPK